MEYSPCSVENSIREEIEYLQKLGTRLSEAENDTARITVWKSGKTYQYREYTTQDNTHQTLSKRKKEKQIQRLCQSEYHRVVEKMAAERMQLLVKILPRIEAMNLEKAVLRLHPGKREMLKSYIADEEAFAAAWAAQPFAQKEPPEKGYRTERGEIVRSKSEMIIANKLFANGIPYRYEAEMRLAEFTVHPDFTVLNRRTRATLVWEHFGMTGDLEYATSAYARQLAYQKSGYLPGRDLIVTMESPRQPMDSRQAQKIIDAYLR